MHEQFATALSVLQGCNGWLCKVLWNGQLLGETLQMSAAPEPLEDSPLGFAPVKGKCFLYSFGFFQITRARNRSALNLQTPCSVSCEGVCDTLKNADGTNTAAYMTYSLCWDCLGALFCSHSLQLLPFVPIFSH